MSSLFLMVTITDRRSTDAFLQLYEQRGVDVNLRTVGSGTAVRETLPTLGLEKTEKAVLLAVVTEDEKTLTAANGIGKKIAQRVILELKDKLAREEALDGTSVKGGAPAMAAVPHSKKSEAQSALAVLGYGSAEIAAALKDIDMEALTLEDIIRQALKRMMK